MAGRESRIAGIVVLGILAAAVAAAGQTDNGEWRSYGGDIANTRYAPLDRITAENFNDLEVAWRLRTANFGPEPEYNFQSTPLMVDGVIYTTAGLRRAAVAADAGTGELLWMHRLDEGERAEVAPRRRSGRGLAYRDDGGDGQIFYVTPGYRLVGLNAKTGERLADFGEDGIVDLMQNMDQEID
ncbi:MAG: PQQ-binding-like beta-propeller repeat protein, partial [Acidobacteria bacterium]|nr:PQQ-binding-like beta-propeller repeat protein [Acidobacteriota bacterium]